MFRNDNKKSPKKLSDASIKHSLQRNAFIMVSIIIATCLIMAVALFFMGQNQAAKKDSYGRFQASLVEMPLEKVDELRQVGEELEIGLTSSLGEQQADDYRIYYSYMNEAVLGMGKFPALEGRMPQAINEVAVEKAYLSYIGSTAGVGDIIPLEINGVQGDYTISGIWPRENSSGSYTAIVSQALLGEQVDAPLYSVYLRLKDSDGWDSRDISYRLNEIASENGITEDELRYSPLYFDLHDRMNVAGIIGTLIVTVIVALACALVIYSLFYVSVVGKTQEYGLLRIIGTTKKQVERIVFREGLILCARSLPVGAVLGGLVGYLLKPDGWYWPATIAIALLTCAILLVVIMVASLKPVRLAAKVTPVEAMRHTSYTDDKNDKDTKKLHRSLSPRTLAGINMGRNKKKTVLTILSLGVCGILLMASASYLNAIDFEEMARLSYPRGELVIELGENGPGSYSVANDFVTQQKNSPFTDELMQSIADIDGVEDVIADQGAYNDTLLPSGTESVFMFHGFTPEDEEWLDKDLLSGTFSYDELLVGKGVVVADWADWGMYGWELALGDIVSVKTLTGETMALTVMGIRKDTGLGTDYSMFLLPDGLIAELQPDLENPIYQVTVKAEQGKTEQVEAAVREYMSAYPDTRIQLMSDETAFLESTYNSLKMPIYFIVIFIGVFGLINLVNTLMTNVIVRKKELSVLQTLGLTGKQLRQMILAEGLYYVFGTIALTLSVGTLSGYLLCQAFDTVGTMGTVVYQFPALHAGLYLGAVVLVQVLFSFVSLNTLKKESLVERMRGV